MTAPDVEEPPHEECCEGFDECELGDEGSLRGHSLPVHSEMEGKGSSRKGVMVAAVLLLFITIGLAVGLSIKPMTHSTESTSAAQSTFNQNGEGEEIPAAAEPSTEIPVVEEIEDPAAEQEATFPAREEDNQGVVQGGFVQEQEETQAASPPADDEPYPHYPIHTVIPQEPKEETAEPMPFYPIDTSHRKDAVIDFLAVNGISSKISMMTEGTYANKAVEWIANEDPLAMPVPSLVHPNSTSVTEEHFITRYVLAHFFFATGGTKWHNKLNFLSEKPSCEWYEVVDSFPVGVGCNENDEIAALVLKNNHLQNSLPTELAYFTNLIIMDLDVNFITGTIPDSYEALTKLEIWDMGSNGLGGSLPAWIGGLTDLGSLNLGYNTFIDSIPTELSSLTALRVLALDHNVFEGDVNTLFGSSINGLQLLEELYLDSNAFSGTLGQNFASSMPHMRQLDISNNDFFGHIPSHLFSFAKLEVLDIHENVFTSLPESFEANNALKLFAAQKNIIGGTIPETIVNLAALTHLDLSQNQLQGPISEVFGDTLVNLTYLFLAENAFDPGPIPLSVSNLPSLKELSLKSTQRTGKIPDVVGLLTELVFLDLDHNELSGEIPSSLASLTNLKLLLLNRNKLEGFIPAEFSQLSQLELLFVEGNFVTGGLNAICDNISESYYPIEIVAQCSLCESVAGCCTKCCEDGHECNKKTKVADLDPIWQMSYERVEYSMEP